MITDSVKGLIIAVVVFALFIYGYRYYRYTQDEPDFCASCHVVHEPFVDLQQGKHRDIICQNCHQIGIIEQNKRLGTYILTGKDPVSLAHGRITPWQKCRSCHEESLSQGSVTPTKSFGHARHVLDKKMDCKVCHSSAKHRFGPDEAVCVKCHKDKEVHGLSADDFSCLKCHRFSQRELVMIPRDKCTGCHHAIPSKGAMSTMSCFFCHKPHKKEKPVSSTCTSECHRSQIAVGQHGTHTKKGIECILCHKPHTWNVQNAQTLCSKCHAYKDPRSFVYNF